MRSVVTGGSGFLGRRLVQLLRERGDDVRVFSRRRDADLQALGAVLIQGDIRDAATVRAAIHHADVVFHLAGKTGYWGPEDEFWSVNVDGTRNVLDAARAGGIRCLVYTSTPSVVGYAGEVENGGPQLSYAECHESGYAASKAAAERLVLSANGDAMATVALRPHLIIGPGDHQMLPRVVRRAAQGSLRIIGGGLNRVDLTYVDNAAWAHLDAADALIVPGGACAGKAYFISNGEPVLLWHWLNQLLSALRLPPVTRSLSLPAARGAGAAMELAWRVFRIGGEPPITRFLAAALARSHWYNMQPAERDLGYRIRIPMEEATRRTLQWLAGRWQHDAHD